MRPSKKSSKIPTIKLPKLDLVCENNSYRPVLANVKVTKEFTYASDEHIAVKHRTLKLFNSEFVDSIPDNGILIPSKVIKIINTKKTISIVLTEDKKQIQLNQLDGSKISYKLFTDGNYPNVESVIPNNKDCTTLNEIAISASLLERLAQGMGANHSILHLKFFGASKVILCNTNNQGDYFGAIGVIMPVMINE
jgi:DNA polymerase III sliding clamp (beta) subunit (PCNA family)